MAAREKPMGVMPLCIIAIFLGITGVIGGAAGIVGLLIEPKTAPPSNNPKLAELNVEFQRRILESTKSTRPYSMALMPLVILSSGLLAAAGIAGINLRGLGLLRLGFPANLLVDVIAAAIGFFVQYRTLAIVKWYFRESAGAEKMPAGMEMGMQVGLYTGLFFGVGWLLVKTALYVWGVVYFNKRSVQDAFSGAAPPPSAGPEIIP